MPCTSQPVLGIGGSLVVSCTILESGGTVVCIGKKAVVTGPGAEVGVSEFAPSLQRSVVETVV